MPRRELFGLVTFFLIAFGIPWYGWAVIDDETLSLWLFPLFCSIGGFCAAYVEGGTDGLREFRRRTLRLRGALKWIVLASVIPLALGLSYLLGSGVPLSSMRLSMEAMLGLTLAAALVTGPLAEEFGWRGYLQHKLLRHMRPIWVVLAVGALWCAWHIPLFYSSVFSSPDSALRFLVYVVTWTVFILYLVQRANGSVWPAVFFHWGANTHADV
ncbi:MAG: CPBP family intramembrane glutamic endopeptidase [Lysobacter sp.]